MAGTNKDPNDIIYSTLRDARIKDYEDLQHESLHLEGFLLCKLFIFHSPDCDGAALRVYWLHSALWHLGYWVKKYLGYWVTKHLGYYQEFLCLIDVNLHDHNYTALIVFLVFGLALPYLIGLKMAGYSRNSK